MAGENILFLLHFTGSLTAALLYLGQLVLSGFTMLIPEELYLETFLGDMISVIYTQTLCWVLVIILLLILPLIFFFFAYFPLLRFSRCSGSDSVPVGKEGKI